MLTMSQDESAEPPQEANKAIVAFLSMAFIGVLALNLPKSNAVFENLGITELRFIQGNSLIAVSEPCYTNLREEAREEAIEMLLAEITRRESGGDPNICNLQYGCGSGQGLTGVIPSTERTCEEALGRELDMFEPEDNLACARWLLETRGIWPWEPYSGSYVKFLLELDSLFGTDLYEEMYLN